jgi:hypothetical protein
VCIRPDDVGGEVVYPILQLLLFVVE